MCGIVGIIGKPNVEKELLKGLKKLEYRGYDSAGMAFLDKDGGLRILKETGKIVNLEEVVLAQDIESTVGIGHTRWATHGAPNRDNAHPHFTDKLALVHNGIIENYKELRVELSAKGYPFRSETDTEVIAWLVTDYLNQGLKEFNAVEKAVARLKGAYALAIIFNRCPDLIIGARQGSPLAIGYGEDAMYLGSDALALSSYTDTLCYLEEGDLFFMKKRGAKIKDKHGRWVARKIKTLDLAQADSDKGDFDHYMLKEIFEQTQTIKKTVDYVFDLKKKTPKDLKDILGFPAEIDFRSLKKITLVACGTSYYACCVAKYWIEHLAPISIEIDVASEFRYRTPFMEEGGLAVFISQSGETADTLAALRYCKKYGQKILSIVNVPESTIDRESDVSLFTQAGPEIGVASTKAFTNQLVILLWLAVKIAFEKNVLKEEKQDKLIQTLKDLPGLIEEGLQDSKKLEVIASKITHAKTALYLGRGISYPIAMEGALKLKEISYIHAEAYAAGEMKHGPIALVDESVPVVCFAPFNQLFEKTASNIEEIIARKANVILISDKEGLDAMGDKIENRIEIPKTNIFSEPFLTVLPAQIFAYYVAVLKENNVDQPRNLAKSVTVE
ncbi:MAG: glutamine--fructose-6-phosphate transaminase (isomerizing) [Alphaproteobacteria bacterium]|nr:glutamine--fructose-6-phosphate transaminase (isomerizing) [Alphaproteobacteria bacterium]